MQDFNIGDRVRITSTTFISAPKGKEGIIVVSYPHNRYLIDLGIGFDGHDGNGLHSKETCLYIYESDLEKIDNKENKVNVSELGSLRYNNDKPQVSQIDPQFLLDFADLMTVSARKYSKWNYALGQDLTTPCDSMSRHLLKFLAGENNDKESGCSHLLHIAANAMIAWCSISYHLEDNPQLDNRINKSVSGYKIK